MAQSLGFDDFKPGKVDLLRSFCKKRGLVVSGRRKDELVALAFAAVCQNLPVVLDKDRESKEVHRRRRLRKAANPFEWHSLFPVHCSYRTAGFLRKVE